MQDIVGKQELCKHTCQFACNPILGVALLHANATIFNFQVSEATDTLLRLYTVTLSVLLWCLVSSVQIFRFLLFCISAMKVFMSTFNYQGKTLFNKEKYIEINTMNTGWKLSSSFSPALVVRFSRAPLATRTLSEKSVSSTGLFKSRWLNVWLSSHNELL